MTIYVVFVALISLTQGLKVNSIVQQLNEQSKTATFVNYGREFPRMELDSKDMIDTLKLRKKYTPKGNIQDVPDSYDWRDYNKVTQVKNQYSCGTCWAFSTTGNIEGQWNISTDGGDLTSLSEEFLVDCDNNDCGMFGGWPYLAYEYIIEQNGIPSESSYPYCCGANGRNGEEPPCYPCMASGYNRTFCGNHNDLYCNATWDNIHCPANDWQAVSKIKDWMAISTDEDVIQQSLYEIGPLSVCMNAESLSWYRSGIYDPNFCDPESLDHAVLLVGYGSENGTDYWTVKNSWGEDWGEDGYFRILRGTGECGINTAVTTSCIGECQT